MKVRAWLLVLVAMCVGCTKDGRGDSGKYDVATTPGNTTAPPRGATSPHEALPDVASPVVYLGKSPGFFVKTRTGEDRGLLVREFFRQALLIAAREELSLVTRDAWLGDAIPGSGPIRPYELASRKGGEPRLEVLRGFSPAMKQVGVAAMPPYSGEEYGKRLFIAAEKLSRTSLLEILRKDYGTRPSRPWNPDLTLPKAVEDSLREMSFLIQFKAVRQIHDFTAAKGQSPATLAALVRGYANLGILTEFHWHPAHKVFKARAILYAQRWLARQPDSLLALWHRAYALTLTGLHAEAIVDLQAAQKAWQAMAEKDRPKRPGWVVFLEACCRYEVDTLAAEPEHAEHGQLAALLQYHTVELAGNQRWALQVGLATLQKIPECYRVHDGVCFYGGVSVRHGATLATFRILGRTLYGRVRDMPDIPEAVRRQARRSNSSGPRSVFSFGDDRSDLESEFKSRARLIAALRKASAPQTAAKKKDDVQKAAKTPAGEQVAMGSDAKPVAIPPDAGEPSLAALAQLIQEVSFLHIWRRAYFERCTLDCSTDLFLKVAIPLVADHPLRPFLESFAWDVAKYREAMDRASRLTPDGLELHAYQILSDLRRCHLEAGNAMYRAMYNHSDDLARDFAVLCRIFPNKPSALAMYARNLLEISPHSPLAKTFLVDARVASKSQLAEWKSLAAKYPALANALAGYSDEAKQWDDAIRYCQMAIEIVDDKGMYEFLAELYLKKKDEGRWLKTLEAALQLPDRGLDHSEIQRRIADHFMNKKEWKRALPHALAAAESYSGAGLNCASRCYEGLGEWKKAEQYLQAKGERYRSSSLDWYYFCRRTGKGDLQAARELAESFLNDPSAHTAEEISFCAVEFYLLEKQVEKALAVYRRSFAEKPDPFFGLWVAILADELQNPKTRDAALERIRVKGPSYVRKDVGRVRTELIEVAAWITRDLARGGKGEIARQDMDKVLVPIKGSYEMAYAYMFLARYLESHGKREEAVRCWKKNVVPTDGPHIARYLAIAALNDLGIKVDDQSPSAVEEPKSNAKTSPLTSKADKNAGQRKTNQKEAKEASKAVPQGPQKDDVTPDKAPSKKKSSPQARPQEPAKG